MIGLTGSLKVCRTGLLSQRREGIPLLSWRTSSFQRVCFSGDDLKARAIRCQSVLYVGLIVFLLSLGREGISNSNNARSRITTRAKRCRADTTEGGGVFVVQQGPSFLRASPI